MPYTFRQKQNIPNKVYDPTRKNVFYVEDLTSLENAINDLDSRLSSSGAGSPLQKTFFCGSIDNNISVDTTKIYVKNVNLLDMWLHLEHCSNYLNNSIEIIIPQTSTSVKITSDIDGTAFYMPDGSSLPYITLSPGLWYIEKKTARDWYIYKKC